MADIDFSKLEKPLFDTNQIYSSVPTMDYSHITKQVEENTRKAVQAVQEAREERDAESLRRHNELLTALREAGEKGATIIVGDNANGIQIQQNSSGATQTMHNSQGLDYDQVISVLNEIKGYFDYPQFQETFGDNSESIKTVVEETLKAAKNKEDEGFIKKSLKIVKDIAIKTTVSLVSAGIIALLGSLPIG